MQEQAPTAFILTCTDDSLQECIARRLLASERAFGPVVVRIKPGDYLFLNNTQADTLIGLFRAVTSGAKDIESDAFGGRYPFQVRVAQVDTLRQMGQAKKFLKSLSIDRRTCLSGDTLAAMVEQFEQSSSADTPDSPGNLGWLAKEARAVGRRTDIEVRVPPLESTTLWDFPSQSYGPTRKGDNAYAGVTPALIIYNLIWRYTDPGDVVLDPMCGSGTTIDVCLAEHRKALGFDIAPTRPDIIQNDARTIPLDDESVDMVFIDSPYGDNIKYNDQPANIGNISSESAEFYDALEAVMRECARVLRPGKALGWLIGDQWVNKRYTPVGFMIYERLTKYFEPVDLICVARRNQYSNTGIWHGRALRHNFYLRGFKHLIVVRKARMDSSPTRLQMKRWTQYERPRQIPRLSEPLPPGGVRLDRDLSDYQRPDSE